MEHGRLRATSSAPAFVGAVAGFRPSATLGEAVVTQHLARPRPVA